MEDKYESVSLVQDTFIIHTYNSRNNLTPPPVEFLFTNQFWNDDVIGELSESPKKWSYDIICSKISKNVWTDMHNSAFKWKILDDTII